MSVASASPRFGLLRACTMAFALALFATPFTVGSGIAAAAVGGAGGVLLGQRAAAGRLRLASGLLLAAVTTVIGLQLARGMVVSSTVARLLGPIATFSLAEATMWLSLALPVVTGLRFLALRRPALAVTEVVTVSLAVAWSVAAHRDGMIHRPFAIGDWAWSRGIDPGILLLALGGLASFVLAALLIAEHRWRRLPLHFAFLLALALALILVIRVTGPPVPRAGSELGLTGDPSDAEPDEGEGGEGGQQDSDELRDLPFKNEYQTRGGEAPVAVVVLHDDYEPPSSVYYFRQTAFSQFNGHRLVQATRPDVDHDIVPRFPSKLLTIAGPPSSTAVRLPVPTSVGLLTDHVRPFALESPIELRPIDNPNPARFRRAFGARSLAQALPYEELLGRRPGDPDWDDTQWQHYTEAPTDTRYAETAARLVAGLRPDYRDDPLAKALVIKDYLDTEGIYSRKSQHADTTDPTASFLFGDLTGYCVHFAHAATYLLRSIGVPTRVAAGYALPESARAGGSSLMIRGLNAHAWPEIYLEGVGWVTVDPAPQQSLDQATSQPDQALQRMLGNMMRMQDQPPSPDDPLIERLQLARIGLLLLLALTTLALFGLAAKVWRQLAPHLLPATSVARVGYRAALDQLAEVGLKRRFGESREHFARRAGSLSPSFTELSDHHVGWAMGSHRPIEATHLRALLVGVRREIDHHVPTWRRLLGALDPIAWLRVR